MVDTQSSHHSILVKVSVAVSALLFVVSVHFLSLFYRFVTMVNSQDSIPFIQILSAGLIIAISLLSFCYVYQKPHNTVYGTLAASGMLLLALSILFMGGGCKVSSGDLLFRIPHLVWDSSWLWRPFNFVAPGVGLSDGRCFLLTNAVTTFLGYLFLGVGIWFAPQIHPASDHLTNLFDE